MPAAPRKRARKPDYMPHDGTGAAGAKVTKEDIFYSVVGVLHSPGYRARFASDLKKMLPRIPFTRKTTDLRKDEG